MNIILIGMPGSGKSTCGQKVSQELGMSFLDTDALIIQNEGQSLSEIISHKGRLYFEQLEEQTVKTLYTRNCVIATGGSVVYSKPAMQNLKSAGIVIFLNISYSTMLKRVRNHKKRGIVLKDGYTLKDMYQERIGLYKEYADFTVDCNNNSVLSTIKQIIKIYQDQKEKTQI